MFFLILEDIVFGTKMKQNTEKASLFVAQSVECIFPLKTLNNFVPWLSFCCHFQSQLTVVPSEECNKSFHGVINDQMFCTFNGEMYGTCHGDQGGAAAWKVDGSWEIAGVTSWAYSCGRFPDAFMNLKGICIYY